MFSMPTDLERQDGAHAARNMDSDTSSTRLSRDATPFNPAPPTASSHTSPSSASSPPTPINNADANASGVAVGVTSHHRVGAAADSRYTTPAKQSGGSRLFPNSAAPRMKIHTSADSRLGASKHMSRTALSARSNTDDDEDDGSDVDTFTPIRHSSVFSPVKKRSSPPKIHKIAAPASAGSMMPQSARKPTAAEAAQMRGGAGGLNMAHAQHRDNVSPSSRPGHQARPQSSSVTDAPRPFNRALSAAMHNLTLKHFDDDHGMMPPAALTAPRRGGGGGGPFRFASHERAPEMWAKDVGALELSARDIDTFPLPTPPASRASNHHASAAAGIGRPASVSQATSTNLSVAGTADSKPGGGDDTRSSVSGGGDSLMAAPSKRQSKRDVLEYLKNQSPNIVAHCLLEIQFDAKHREFTQRLNDELVRLRKSGVIAQPDDVERFQNQPLSALFRSTNEAEFSANLDTVSNVPPSYTSERGSLRGHGGGGGPPSLSNGSVGSTYGADRFSNRFGRAGSDLQLDNLPPTFSVSDLGGSVGPFGGGARQTPNSSMPNFRGGSVGGAHQFQELGGGASSGSGAHAVPNSAAAAAAAAHHLSKAHYWAGGGGTPRRPGHHHTPFGGGRDFEREERHKRHASIGSIGSGDNGPLGGVGGGGAAGGGAASGGPIHPTSSHVHQGSVGTMRPSVTMLVRLSPDHEEPLHYYQGQDPRAVVKRFCQAHRARPDIYDKLCDELLDRVRSVSARPPPTRHDHGGGSGLDFGGGGGGGGGHRDYPRHGSRAGSHRHSYGSSGGGGGGGGPRFRDSLGGGSSTGGGGGRGPRNSGAAGDLPSFDGLLHGSGPAARHPFVDRFQAASCPPDFGGNIPPTVQGDPLAGVYPPSVRGSRGGGGQFPPY